MSGRPGAASVKGARRCDCFYYYCLGRVALPVISNLAASDLASHQWLLLRLIVRGQYAGHQSGTLNLNLSAAVFSLDSSGPPGPQGRAPAVAAMENLTRGPAEESAFRDWVVEALEQAFRLDESGSMGRSDAESHAVRRLEAGQRHVYIDSEPVTLTWQGIAANEKLWQPMEIDSMVAEDKDNTLGWQINES